MELCGSPFPNFNHQMLTPFILISFISCHVVNLLLCVKAQDEAIERGLQRVEAGAQGQETKIPRGYLPSKTYSSHYIRDPTFRSVLDTHLQREQQAIDYNLAALNLMASPFKKAVP